MLDVPADGGPPGVVLRLAGAPAELGVPAMPEPPAPPGAVCEPALPVEPGTVAVPALLEEVPAEPMPPVPDAPPVPPPLPPAARDTTAGTVARASAMNTMLVF
jgi:hypothetical protein